MELPKFLLGDNTDYQEAIFVIHTEYPRFVINLQDDDITWFDDLEEESEEEILDLVQDLVAQANAFFDRETARFEHEA
ncbi:MAG: hypothetical protein CO023_05830 [Flavobacteriales bacterium CG_4_9_14_0_2_um_filter_35_242]|nr:hypothetical protein [Zetaproteobacteria bacterium]NDK17934.1 hypothetical protein [Flavobacteriales bacterium]OIO12330.1 MAG: hypothetical protein AUJ53_02600 [Flavobacteriaceae bacterium CG1_02_35_72]PIR12421.1 MAG: hypothetical protein COV50_09180 [Flavobacteriales bacterium CG11_big_fil_rev_8_21_14_0_20_35_7]PIV17386.1 MAG: hypothetical protein COS42_05100 [Flavobacteriales bacterium CG03_land_8_20_14_0_80_35_15]PIX07747.1 MAG: hypothetical protein COZ76_01800 [Flavobacteriales bacteriu